MLFKKTYVMFTSKMNERYNEKGRIQIRPFML